MKSIRPLLICLAMLVQAANAAEFRINDHNFTLPDGFELETAAGPQLVPRPISFAFDEQGRLYVTDSSGSNEKVQQQLEEKPHRVMRLEDVDGDGRFDKSAVFADKMMFPEGCMWHEGSVYVSAPPSIWKLTDTDDDGVADKREEWHQGKTLTGCANDLHGPYLGPDGWIYWCKGAFAEQRYTLANGREFVSRAAHIFRARPDGSGIEPVLTGGMDNPVGLAFTPTGERIMCGTFFITHEPGKRDGLIHAIYGGVYGKINAATDGHQRTGDLMPIMTHMGAAAPAAVTRYDSRVFGEEFRDNLFVCLFNMHKVTRNVPEPDGSTFKTKDSDFLVSDNPDFHPTDVMEDADGSLLVIDTGGWYKICCPTSQLSKPDVLGAIYRIRRRGAPKVNDPRGSTLAWGKMKPAKLANLLDDSRPAVRNRAIRELSNPFVSRQIRESEAASEVKQAVKAVAATLQKSKSTAVRQKAVWTLTQIDTRAAREAVRAVLTDADAGVVHAAIHSVSVRRDWEAKEQLLTILRNANPQLQRAAAEALGRVDSASSVPALLSVLAQPRDRVLEHSLIYALIEIGDPNATAAGLRHASEATRRAALIALDQMDAELKPADVIAFLKSPDAATRKAAAWVASHHPDWGEALSGFFRGQLAAHQLSDAEREELGTQLAQFAKDESIQKLMAETLVQATDSGSSARGGRLLVLNAMANAGLSTAPAAWKEAVDSCLAEKDQETLRAAVATARALAQAKTNAPDFSVALLRIANDANRPADLRLDALAAVAGGVRVVEPDIFGFLCANLDSSGSVSARSAASSVLARARLSDEQLLALADVLKSAGPLEITKLLAAFERSTNENLGLRLIASLRESKGLAGIRADALKTLAAKYPPTVQEQAEKLIASLNVDAAKQNAHISALLPQMAAGDIRRGQAVFNSQKAACASCHRIGYHGGNVGPDLTSIGQVRTERDLLEAIVYPNASFVRSYEPLIVSTRSDEEYSGVLRQDAADEIVLATGPTTEVRIARSDISEMRPGAVSVMPGGLDQMLSSQELADLVAFLKGTKWGAR